MSFPSKLKATAIGLLLLLTGIFLYRVVSVRGQRRTDYSPTTPVSANTPIPDDFSLSVLQQALVFPHSDKFPTDEEAFYAPFRRLPAGVIVVTDPPLENQALAALFQETFTEGQKDEICVKPGCGLSILAAGPLLEPANSVRVRGLRCQGKRLKLEIIHGPLDPPKGQPAPENKKWRPLLLVPVLLPAGSYQLEVTWLALDKIRGGKPLPGAPLVQTCSFAAPAGMVESPALRVHGVDFQTLADERCPLPEEGQRRSLHLGLRVTNRMEKELLFEPSGVQLRADNLHGATGSVFRYHGGSRHTIIAEPVAVASGQSRIFILRSKLGWYKDFPLRDKGLWKGGHGLFLSGVIGSGDTYWHYDGLAAGKHRISFDYHAGNRPHSFWTGHVRTQDAAFEIVP